MNLLVLTADPKTLLCHRREMLTEMAARGCRITAAASGPGGDAAEFIRSLGGEYHSVRMTRSGLNPLKDLQTLRDFRALIRRVQPDAVFAYTIKSVAYGCLAAAQEKVRGIFPLICGLGYAFAPDGTLKQRLVSAVSSRLYQMALRRATHVFLQNTDDEQLLRSRRILPAHIPSTVVPGSGVDLDAFAWQAPDTAAAEQGTVRFLLVSRLLKSKGVPQFAEAARRLRAQHPGWEFHLVGPADPGPDGISTDAVQQWQREGIIHWHGPQQDVRPFLRRAHIFVLPTYYREGVPRTLLEALSSGLPLITTDSTGARETLALTEEGRTARSNGQPVMPALNGVMIRPRCTDALVSACEYAAHPARMAAMSVHSRRLAASTFDVRTVNALITSRMKLPPAAAADIMLPAAAPAVS
jgi:glycosyltransferase involved in cell wall biosynthesis